jgi:glycosyltransferase involved in cell wall biosynthesis
LHIHTLPVISGSGINTLLTMTGLDKGRFEVELACAPGGALVDESVKRGIKFRPVRHFVQRVSPFNDLFALAELILLMRGEKYDIVHSHNSKAGFIGRLAARITRVPAIVHTIHGFAFHDIERPPRRALFRSLERFAAPMADKLIVISNPLREWGLGSGIGKPEQYVTIYSGIELGRFQADLDVEKIKRELGISPDDLVVGAVSKLWEGKGHRCLLRAARDVVDKIPGVKFLFVGEGYLRGELESLRDSLGLQDKVIFTGFRSDIPEITACFDIAVLASLFEGLGRVLLEAMAVGKPVIASRVGGIVDVVDDGLTGILVPPGDEKALVSALIRLLSDGDPRKRMGEAGKRKIDSRFSAKTMVNEIEKVYNELISGNRENAGDHD